jgi:hypothetical protein
MVRVKGHIYVFISFNNPAPGNLRPLVVVVDNLPIHRPASRIVKHKPLPVVVVSVTVNSKRFSHSDRIGKSSGSFSNSPISSATVSGFG